MKKNKENLYYTSMKRGVWSEEETIYFDIVISLEDDF